MLFVCLRERNQSCFIVCIQRSEILTEELQIMSSCWRFLSWQALFIFPPHIREKNNCSLGYCCNKIYLKHWEEFRRAFSENWLLLLKQFAVRMTDKN